MLELSKLVASMILSVDCYFSASILAPSGLLHMKSASLEAGEDEDLDIPAVP